MRECLKENINCQGVVMKNIWGAVDFAELTIKILLRNHGRE